MIGKLILGLLLLMAAAVLVNPNLSTPIWNFIVRGEKTHRFSDGMKAEPPK